MSCLIQQSEITHISSSFWECHPHLEWTQTSFFRIKVSKIVIFYTTYNIAEEKLFSTSDKSRYLYILPEGAICKSIVLTQTKIIILSAVLFPIKLSQTKSSFIRRFISFKARQNIQIVFFSDSDILIYIFEGFFPISIFSKPPTGGGQVLLCCAFASQ